MLRKFVEDLLPDDIHERCRDKAYVAVTRECASVTIFPFNVVVTGAHSPNIMAILQASIDPFLICYAGVFPRPTPELISDFESKDDLVCALCLSVQDHHSMWHVNGISLPASLVHTDRSTDDQLPHVR